MGFKKTDYSLARFGAFSVFSVDILAFVFLFGLIGSKQKSFEKSQISNFQTSIKLFDPTFTVQIKKESYAVFVSYFGDFWRSDKKEFAKSIAGVKEMKRYLAEFKTAGFETSQNSEHSRKQRSPEEGNAGVESESERSEFKESNFYVGVIPGKTSLAGEVSRVIEIIKDSGLHQILIKSQ